MLSALCVSETKRFEQSQKKSKCGTFNPLTPIVVIWVQL